MKTAQKFELNNNKSMLNNQHISNKNNVMLDTDLVNILKAIGRAEPTPHPVVIECGERPPDADINCNVTQKPCLYNITNDPCEFHNLADTKPDVLRSLLDFVETFNKTAVPPRNKPNDPKGFPG